jgi:leucyl aminopeptidase
MKFQLAKNLNKINTLIIPLMSKELENNLKNVIATFSLPTPIIQDFKAEAEETTVLYANSSAVEKVILLGLGEKPSTENFRKTFRGLFYKQKEKLGQKVAIDFSFVNVDNFKQEETVEACVNGCLLATYNIAKFKTLDKKENKFPEIVTFLTAPTSSLEKAISKGEILANTQQRIFDLVNLPSNHINSLKLAAFAENSGKDYGFSVRVLHLDEIKKLGMGGLVAINQASDTPATFTIMEYKPITQEPLKKIGLVGKGVTFDTGGVSIKTSDGMWQMKCDMAGAAAVIGAVEAVARLQLPIHVIGIVPSTDNMISGKSICPGDIVHTYSGISIEIEDTDAEGRVILADGLSYLNKNFSPDVIIDLATLTGASVIALGYHAAAMFTNNDGLAQKMSEAGYKTQERVWRMPLWDDYDKQIKSDMADVKNLGGRPAGAITAAKFLEKFTDKHPAWVHLDIAGVAFTDSPFSNARSATGYGVRLLVEYLEQIAQETI